MAITYTKTSTTSAEQSLFRVYDFVANSGQTAVRFVGAGATPAIYKAGTGYVASFTSASDCPDGSYVLLEPTSASVTRWQLQIKNGAFDTLYATFAPDGTWSNGGAGPGSFSGTVTSETQINDGGAPSGGSTIDCCAGTSDLGGGSTGTFFWCNIRDSGSGTPDQFMYAGCYTPARIAYDTKPCVFLSRIPTLGTEQYSLGSNSSNFQCLSRCGTEVAHSTTWTTSGYCRLGVTDAAGQRPGSSITWRDQGGYYIAPDLWLVMNNTGDKRILGKMGEHVLAMDVAVSNYDTDGTYIRVGDLWLKTV